MNVPPTQQGNIFSIANAGLAIGALGFGLVVDVIGRKWAFNLTCLITSIFGLLLVCFLVQQEKQSFAKILQGCTQIQLRCDMCDLLPRIARARR